MNAIDIQDLSFSYGSLQVIDGLNLKVKSGENIVIIGDNGSGKSTLLKLIIGEIKKDAGTLKIMGIDIENVKNYDALGYVPQIQIANQIAFPVTCMELIVLNQYKKFGLIKIPTKAAKQKAISIIEEMGLKEHMNKPVNQLSGGLKQRTMIARALMNDPQVLILDEPTAGIDDKSKAHFTELVTYMSTKKGLTLVLVTHEINYVVDNICKCKVHRLERGKLSHVRI